MPTIGVNLRVSTDSKQGGRKYMEDVTSVRFEKGEVNGKSVEYAYFAVFDGHGGPEAAQFAKAHLLTEVTKQKGFWSDDDDQVMKAISDGFVSTHTLMWKAVGSWPKTVSGLPSTSGTTASVTFIRNRKMYVAHVGDSSVVMGSRTPDGDIITECVTVDHKPECPIERKRIEASGGLVISKAGVQRVVWQRPKPTHRGPVRRSTPVQLIPFLAVARALGDLWSYNSQRGMFTVSPEPDVCVYDIDPNIHKCVVLASDGLWNMVRPEEAINLVEDVEKAAANSKAYDVKPAPLLVRKAIQRWDARQIRADNTSVMVVMIDPPGLEQEPMRRDTHLSSTSTVLVSDAETDTLSDLEMDLQPTGPDMDMTKELDDSSCSPFIARVKALSKQGPPGLVRNPCLLNMFRIGGKHGTSNRCVFKGKQVTPRSAPAKLKTLPLFHKKRHNHHKNPSLPPKWPVYSDDKASTGNESELGASKIAKNMIAGRKRKLDTDVPEEDGTGPRPLKLCKISTGVASSSCTDVLDSVVSSPVSGTSIKSPLQLDTALESPVTGLVSPIWPTCLENNAEANGNDVPTVTVLQDKSSKTNVTCKHPTNGSSCVSGSQTYWIRIKSKPVGLKKVRGFGISSTKRLRMRAEKAFAKAQHRTRQKVHTALAISRKS